MFEPIELVNPLQVDPRLSRVLAVCFLGVGIMLEYQGADVAAQIEQVTGESGLLESLEGPPGDGAWVWEGRMVTTRDYWGEYDSEMVGTWRPATQAELEVHRDGNFVWEEWRPA